MTVLKPEKLKLLLAAYDAKLEALQESLITLEAAGLITIKRRAVVRARTLVQKHLAEIDAGLFGPKQEATLVRQMDDTMEIASFSEESAFENPRGTAIGAFTAVEKAHDSLFAYVFEQGADDE